MGVAGSRRSTRFRPASGLALVVHDRDRGRQVEVPVPDDRRVFPIDAFGPADLAPSRGGQRLEKVARSRAATRRDRRRAAALGLRSGAARPANSSARRPSGGSLLPSSARIERRRPVASQGSAAAALLNCRRRSQTLSRPGSVWSRLRCSMPARRRSSPARHGQTLAPKRRNPAPSQTSRTVLPISPPRQGRTPDGRPPSDLQPYRGGGLPLASVEHTVDDAASRRIRVRLGRVRSRYDGAVIVEHEPQSIRQRTLRQADARGLEQGDDRVRRRGLVCEGWIADRPEPPQAMASARGARWGARPRSPVSCRCSTSMICLRSRLDLIWRLRERSTKLGALSPRSRTLVTVKIACSWLRLKIEKIAMLERWSMA